MLEQFFIEQLENELQLLYSKLEHTSNEDERDHIMQAIQERNLRLVRFCPNE